MSAEGISGNIHSFFFKRDPSFRYARPSPCKTKDTPIAHRKRLNNMHGHAYRICPEHAARKFSSCLEFFCLLLERSFLKGVTHCFVLEIITRYVTPIDWHISRVPLNEWYGHSCCSVLRLWPWQKVQALSEASHRAKTAFLFLYCQDVTNECKVRYKYLKASSYQTDDTAYFRGPCRAKRPRLFRGTSIQRWRCSGTRSVRGHYF